MYLRAILLLTIMLTFLVAPDVAMAQANIFTPVIGDKSMELLRNMFGTLGVFGESGQDPFASVIMTFNSAVLTIGGVLVSYTILIGTIGTAHDGEMLGKKFSSAWVPIRTAAGTALVLPVIGGGYCVMQAIVGWLIVQGIGLADKVWGAYVDPNTIGKSLSIQSNQKEDLNTAWSIFSAAACMRGFEHVHQELLKNEATKNAVSPTLKFGPSTTVMGQKSAENAYWGNVEALYFGASTPGDGFHEATCGSVNITSSKGPTTATTPGKLTNLIDFKEINSLVKSSESAQKAALSKLIKDIDSVAIAFAQNPSSELAISGVRSAAAAYTATNKNSAASIVGKLGDFSSLSTAANQDGWILAGAWYMRLAYLTEAIGKLTSRQPETVGAPANVNGLQKNYSDIFMQKYGPSLSNLKTVSANKVGVSEVAVYNQTSSAEAGGSGMFDWVSSGFNLDTVFKYLFKNGVEFVINDGEHPIMAMKGVGNWIMTIAGGVLTGLASVLFGAGLLPRVGEAIAAAGPAIQVLSFMIVAPMLGIGFTLSYVLPMMPFMIWIGVVLGWIVLCVEAIIAAPMWAVMHLSPHGDDMVGTGGQGYRLVLSLMLRPVLMIFGLIAALTIITIFGGFINEIWASVFLLSQQDTNFIVLTLSLIAAPFLYLGIMWTLITKTMSIIHVIPDQLLQWFGGGGPQIGDYGQTFGGKGAQSFEATGQVASLVSRAPQAAKEVKDLNFQKEQTEKQKQSVEGDKMSRITSSWDAKGGAGTSDILKAALSQENAGISMNSENLSQADMSKLKDITDANNILGGAEAPLAESFRSDMGQQMVGGATFSQAYSGALQNSLTEKYGSGAASYIANSSNSFSNKGEMRKALANVEYASSKYSELPPTQREEKMNTFFKNVESMGSFESALAVKEGKDSGMSGGGFKENPSGGKPGDSLG